MMMQASDPGPTDTQLSACRRLSASLAATVKIEIAPGNRLDWCRKGVERAPYALGISEPAFLGDVLDRRERLFEHAPRRVGSYLFGGLRRGQSRLAVKEPRKVARAHRHAIRQDRHVGFRVRLHPRPCRSRRGYIETHFSASNNAPSLQGLSHAGVARSRRRGVTVGA
jgi:hypothetical protein